MPTFISACSKYFCTCFFAVYPFLFIPIYVTKKHLLDCARMHSIRRCRLYGRPISACRVIWSHLRGVRISPATCNDHLHRITGILKSFKTVAVRKCAKRRQTAVFSLTRLSRNAEFKKPWQKESEALDGPQPDHPFLLIFLFLSFCCIIIVTLV